MRNQKTYKIVGSIFILIAVGMLISSYGPTFSWFKPNIKIPGIDILKSSDEKDSTDVLQEKKSELDSVDMIEIKSVSEDINIYLVQSDEVTAKLTGHYSKNKSPELILTKSGDKIEIKLEYPKISFSFGNFSSNGKLDVYIPDKYSDELDISSTSGEIKAEGLETSDIKTSTISGEIILKKVKTGKFTINSTSGNVDMASIDADDIEIRTISGEVTADDVKTDDMSVKSTSGSCNIDDFSGKVSFASISGDVEINVQKLVEDIDIKTTSGSTRISLPEDSDFEFDYNTVSGSFSSNFEYTIKDSNKRNDSTEGFYGEKDQKISVNTVSGSLKIQH